MIRGCLAWTLVFFMAPWVRAEGAQRTEPVRVVYRAPSECPNQVAFEAELAEHLGEATVARLDELARTLTIVIDGVPGAFNARVELVDREGHETQRVLTAPTCDQAMRAIALVAALAARSQAERDAERAAAPEGPTPLQPSPETSPSPGGANETDTTRGKRAAPEVAGPTTSRTPESPAAIEREVSAGVGVATGVGPGAAAGLALGGRLGRAGNGGRSLALLVLANDTFRRNLAAADARFRLIRARLELCPFEPLLTSSVRLSPCPGIEAGSQSGQSYADGVRVVTEQSESLLWVAATLALRLRFRVGALAATLGPELIVPITRNRFALSRPERPLYDVPAVAVGAGATLGFVW